MHCFNSLLQYWNKFSVQLESQAFRSLRIEGLHCIAITDRDGVPILKDEQMLLLVATDKTPEAAMRPGFLSTFGMASDQGSKLGLGKNKTIICFFSTYQVIQVNDRPLVISFIAANTSNTGHILALEYHLQHLLVQLKDLVVEV